MATKKQKREAALAKREEFLKDERAAGLEAQKADRERELNRIRKMKQAGETVNHERLVFLLNHGVG